MKSRASALFTLGSQGMSHILVPVLAIVLIAGFGTFKLVASHADNVNCPVTITTTTTPTQRLAGCTTLPPKTTAKPPISLPSAPATTLGPKATAKPPITLPTAAQVAAKAAAKAAHRRSVSGTGADQTQPPAATTDTPPPVVVPNTSLTTLPPVPTPKPEVNIAVYTYIKNGSTRNRIGSVQIKIARAGGGENCNTHTTNGAITNGLEYSSSHVLIKGTAHFLGCTAGKYTVTALGRSGYKVISDKTKSVDLSSQDQTAKVSFVLEKK